MAPPSSSPKLAELKLRVYALAGVSSTRALKMAQPEFASLDFRRKSSWLQVQECLTQPCSESETFDHWLSDPPEEYRELFDQINSAASACQHGIDTLRKASHELRTAAEELEHQASAALEAESRHRRN